jgi:phytoene/squalene synthetase
VTDLVGTTTPSYGADRDWLLRFCPPESTRALTALFEVENEVMGSLKRGLEHSVAHARLEWWHDELTRLAQGAPRHPATRTLASAAFERGTTPPDLTGLVEHLRVDLACVAFLSRSELDEHLQSWGRSIFRAAALLESDRRSLGDSADADRPVAERLAANAGSLVRELELLRDFSSHAVAGRIYVPLGDPPEPHAPWTARPLGEKECKALTSRRETISRQLKQLAAETSPAARPTLRIPMLWMAFALAQHRSDSALLSPLRRTIAAWRGSLALSRGRLPTELT